MAQLVVAAAGAAIGGLTGGFLGPQIGWAIGSAIGASLFPTKTEGPRLSDLRVSGTEYGQVIPWVAGSPRISGQIIWASQKRETGTTQSQGKGGGPEYTSFTYDVDLLYLLSENEIASVSKIWLNGDLVYDGTTLRSGVMTDFRVLNGASDQLPDPTYEAAVGSVNAPAYRTRGCILIQGLQLGQSGQIPNLTFEVNQPTFGDEYYDNVILLMNANGDLPPLDSSPLNNSASLVNGASYTTGKFNEGFNFLRSGSVRPSGPYVSVSNSDTGFIIQNSQDFTIELWLYINSTNYSQTNTSDIIKNGGVTSEGISLRIWNTDRQLAFGRVNSNWIGPNSNTQITLGQFQHIAITRQGSTVRFFIDGILKQTTTNSNAIGIGGANIEIGGNSTVNSDNTSIDGIVDDLRITRGICRYTANFDVPTSEFAASSGSSGYETDGMSIDLKGCCNLLMQRAGYSVSDFDVSELSSITKQVRALAISQNGNTRTILETLQSAYFFEVAKSDKIYFRPRASSPVATIDYDDLATRGDISEDVEPFALKFANDLETPAQVSVSFNNVEADYQIGTEYSDRLISGQESVTNVQIPLGFTSSEGKGIADAILLDQIASQNSATITLPLEYAYLEPSDVVTISTPDRSYRARLVTKKESNGIIEFDLVLDDANALESAEITDSDYPTQPTVQQIASTVWEALDIPLLRDADNTPGFYVAVKPDTDGDLWPGAGFFSSWDDVSYANLLTFSSRATFGTCTTTLGDWTGGNRFDETNTLTVNVGSGTLSSSTRSAMLNDLTINVMVVGSELIRFRTATLVSSGVYTLSGLIRGFRGTEWAIGGHAASERCILLDSAVLRSVSQTSELNLLRYIKAVTSGFTLGSATSEQFTDTGVCLKPFSVANPRALASGSDVVVTWDRRTRLSYVYGGTSPTVPLGEAFERYRIRVYDGSNLVRTEEVSDAQTFTYTAAMISADGFASTDIATFEIVQLSEIIGEGYPAEVEGIIP